MLLRVGPGRSTSRYCAMCIARWMLPGMYQRLYGMPKLYYKRVKGTNKPYKGQL
jgi:hypothetical protein